MKTSDLIKQGQSAFNSTAVKEIKTITIFDINNTSLEDGEYVLDMEHTLNLFNSEGPETDEAFRIITESTLLFPYVMMGFNMKLSSTRVQDTNESGDLIELYLVKQIITYVWGGTLAEHERVYIRDLPLGQGDFPTYFTPKGLVVGQTFTQVFNSIGAELSEHPHTITATWSETWKEVASGNPLVKYWVYNGDRYYPPTSEKLTFTFDETSSSYSVAALDTSIPGSIVIPEVYDDLVHGTHPVTTISDNAFSDCTAITSVNIPDSITSIGISAFNECSSLTSINISENITTIKDTAFRRCSQLQKIFIPNSVTAIGNFAFMLCENLKYITIPANVTSLGLGAFMACYKLSAIYVDEANSTYSSENGVLYNKNKTELITFPSSYPETNFIVPDSVGTIADSSFRYGYSLETLTIGNGVTNINNESFYDCSKLTTVTILDTVATIGEGAFSGCDSLVTVRTNIYRPDAPIGWSTQHNDTFFNADWQLLPVETIFLTTNLGDQKFFTLQETKDYISNNTDITTIALSGTPDASDTNMSGLFENCGTATSIDLSEFNPFLVDNVSNLFKGCSSLQIVDLCTFRTSNSTITDGMFEGCTTVDLAYAKSQEDCDRLNSSVRKSDNVDFIVKPLQMSINGAPAVEYASLAEARTVLKNRQLELVSVVISGCPSQSDQTFFQSFYECTNLEKVNMLGLNADNLTIISGLCWKCLNLKEMLLPDFRLGNLVEVNNLFEGCKSLESIDLTNLDTRNVDMTSAMFNNCQSLKSIDLSRFNTSKTTYMDTMFSSCSSLTELDLSSFDLELVKKGANDAWSSLLSTFSGCTSIVKAYAKNQADCDFLNSNADKTLSPDNLVFTVKPA